MAYIYGPMLFILSVASSALRNKRCISNRLFSKTMSHRLNAGKDTVKYWEKYDENSKYLEEVEGKESDIWVKKRNEHCIKTLGHPERSKDYNRILSILNSKDKIPYVSKIGKYVLFAIISTITSISISIMIYSTHGILDLL